jgi:hypothetical protein
MKKKIKSRRDKLSKASRPGGWHQCLVLPDALKRFRQLSKELREDLDEAVISISSDGESETWTIGSGYSRFSEPWVEASSLEDALTELRKKVRTWWAESDSLFRSCYVSAFATIQKALRWMRQND